MIWLKTLPGRLNNISSIDEDYRIRRVKMANYFFSFIAFFNNQYLRKVLLWQVCYQNRNNCTYMTNK